MLDASRTETLSDTTHIGVLGDLHGDMFHLLRTAHSMAARGIHTLVNLGDFGFISGGPSNWQIDIDKIARKLDRDGQSLYFIDGNHEAFPLLYRFPIGHDGLRQIRANIFHIPRGWRTTIGETHTLAALGGANSIDYHHRIHGIDWWRAQEQITWADLKALGPERADILLGHEVPFGVPSLDRYLSSLPRWPVDVEFYARQSRLMFHRAVMLTRPQLTLGGHYHHFVDDTVTYTDEAGAFSCRVVVLDRNGPGVSQAILDTNTLELEFLHRDGTVAGAPQQ